MRVFKFGGASVKNAEGVKNLFSILSNYSEDKIVVVISAMGKTTNALETILKRAIHQEEFSEELNQLKNFHLDICQHLFHSEHPVFSVVNELFDELQSKLQKLEKNQYDFHYDQIVSTGEMLSTKIVASFLKSQSCNSRWIDARNYIKTDATYRSAKVDLYKTEQNIQQLISDDVRLFITQGFIGGNEGENTTTLGREGSDYSAAIFAYALKTEELIIWKDVDGVYDADPKIFNSPKLIEHLSYKEAVELAFYGASIIHPKTIQPLRERDIVLKVKSFYNAELPGTLVSKKIEGKTNPTSIIVKKNQLLFSLIPRDLSFTNLANMSKALEIIAQHRHQVNIIQNSAVSFSVCLDSNFYHFEDLLKELQTHFIVKYNTDLVLVTIRNYPTDLVETIYDNIKFKLEQRTRSTYQILVDFPVFENQLIQMVELHED